MDNATKGLIIAAGVIITAVVLGFAFAIMTRGTNLFNQGTAQLDATLSGLSDADKQIYDKASMTGSEVITCIKKYLETDGVYVVVATKAGSLRVYDSTFAVATPTTAADEGSVTVLNSYAENCYNSLSAVKLSKTTALLTKTESGALQWAKGPESGKYPDIAGTEDGSYDASIGSSETAYISSSATYNSTIHVDQNNEVRFVVFVQK